MRVFAAGTGLHEPGNVTPAKSTAAPQYFQLPAWKARGRASSSWRRVPFMYWKTEIIPLGAFVWQGKGQSPWEGIAAGLHIPAQHPAPYQLQQEPCRAAPAAFCFFWPALPILRGTR